MLRSTRGTRRWRRTAGFAPRPAEQRPGDRLGNQWPRGGASWLGGPSGPRRGKRRCVGRRRGKLTHGRSRRRQRKWQWNRKREWEWDWKREWQRQRQRRQRRNRRRRCGRQRIRVWFRGQAGREALRAGPADPGSGRERSNSARARTGRAAHPVHAGGPGLPASSPRRDQSEPHPGKRARPGSRVLLEAGRVDGRSVITEEPRADPKKVTELANNLETELARLIVGQKELLRDTVISLISGGHILLEGVPGLGKTMLVRSLGQALELSFSRIQFTPDLMPADIVGTNIIREGDAGRRQFEYQPGPIFARLVLADEVNRATPKTQSALLEAMQER